MRSLVRTGSVWLAALTLAVLAGSASLAQQTPQGRLDFVPPFDIWNVKLGQPIAQIPDKDVGEINCGTNGGPPAQPLKHFTEFAICAPEASGLHEVAFTYDDEQDYIAKAMQSQFEFQQAGTSIYAHPVILSVLVDDQGLAQGIRVVTDGKASNFQRRVAVRLSENLINRYSNWGLDCQDLQPSEGELPVGNQFTHKLCTASKDGQNLRLEGTYFRRKGMVAVNLESQTINKDSYQSATRMEIVASPYKPDTTPAR